MARITRKSLVRQLAEAHQAKEEAEAKLERLKELAREQLSMGKTTEPLESGSAIIVELQPNRYWDKNKALENYGEEICTMQVDQSVAKRKMTGEEYESYYVDRGKSKVIVKVV